MIEFLEKLAECLDRDEISESDVIVDFPEWDSLSVLAVIAMMDSRYSVNVVASDLVGIRTATDLWQLIESRGK